MRAASSTSLSEQAKMCHPITRGDALADFRRFPAWMWRDRDALEPLERTAEWDRGEPPETFPSGI